MTRRSYSDLRVSSPGGKLRLEAASPDNGNELVRDGAPLRGETFGSFQRNFRYRLVETHTETVLWERWQSTGEGSPVSALVSDEGYVVVRAHFLEWGSEELLFVTPGGQKRLVIVVAAEGYLDDRPLRATPKQRRDKLQTATLLWTDEHIQVTTAGPSWTAGSFETFPSSPEASYFCLRTAWGRRLIVDLRRMALIEESALTDAQALVEREERRQALDALRCLAPMVRSGEADWSQRFLVQGALAVVVAQKIPEAAPVLRELEATRSAGSWRPCSVLGAGWYADHNVVRSLARLALRFVGEEPSPGGNYTFTPRFPGAASGEAETVTAPAAMPPRAYELAKGAVPGSTAEWVLASLGPPDFIAREDRNVDKLHVWSEVWDYDGPENTTRLVWSFPESSRREIAAQPRTIVRVEVVESWKKPERLLAVLGFSGPALLSASR
jgi:hypothetical protein